MVKSQAMYLPYDVGPTRVFLGEAEKTPWQTTLYMCGLGPASRVKLCTCAVCQFSAQTVKLKYIFNIYSLQLQLQVAAPYDVGPARAFSAKPRKNPCVQWFRPCIAGQNYKRLIIYSTLTSVIPIEIGVQ